MNATEQRQRHTAVQTAERRIDDLDLVIQALSMEIVQYRDQFGETLERERQKRSADVTHLFALVGKVHELATDIRKDLIGLNVRLANELLPRSNTFIGRLRWLVTGR